MNAAWGSGYASFEAAAGAARPFECVGLGVELMKFRERMFASGIRLGADTIRQVVPDARVCFQPLSMSFGYVNVLEANRECGGLARIGRGFGIGAEGVRRGKRSPVGSTTRRDARPGASGSGPSTGGACPKSGRVVDFAPSRNPQSHPATRNP